MFEIVVPVWLLFSFAHHAERDGYSIPWFSTHRANPW
jgi:hypothetical protein